MQKLICDVCGGKIQIQAGGQEGVCENCGVAYSMARMREILNGVEVSQTSPTEDVQRWRELAKKYYDALSFADAENVVKKILEACPDDPEANQMYEELQVLKYLDICNGVVRGYSGSAKRISIPKGISELDINLFCDDPYLEELVIPEGVQVIFDSGTGDKKWKQSLKRVILPQTLKKIGNSTFSGCIALEEVIIPDMVESIEYAAFCHCESLRHISIPIGVKVIPCGAFFGCSSLNSVTIPNSVTEIDGGGMYGGAFENCKSLTAVLIPDSVTIIGDSAFEGCISLVAIDMPNFVTSICSKAFKDCRALTNVTISSSVKKIGDEAFSGCYSLTELIIPQGVIALGKFAFMGCSSLKKLVIPDSVTEIEKKWYDSHASRWYDTTLCSGCEKLIDVTYPMHFEIALFKGSLFYDTIKLKEARRMAGKCPDCNVKLVGILKKRCPSCGRCFTVL